MVTPVDAETLRPARTEAFIRRALAKAAPNPLRLALYQATRDPELAAMPVIRENLTGDWLQQATISSADADRVREKAFAFLNGDGIGPYNPPDDATTRALIELYHGGPVEDSIFLAGKEELKFEEFPRGVTWDSEPTVEARQAFHVLVIGAGAGGLTAAIQLGRLGIPYTVIERESGPGGTWWVNDYPDARVDIVSHNYQLSYMRNYPWRHFYATQPELREYFAEIVRRYDLTRNIRFDTAVEEARWDEQAACWRITLRPSDGGREDFSAQAVVSAAGLFNAPNLPDIPGIGDFEGPMFHTTAWDHGFDYAGKRVAIIGAGSTGAQLMPRIAQDAAQVTVYQRSPQWIGLREGYRDEVSEELQWLFDTMPHYWNWYCFSLFLINFENVDGLQNFDRDWQKAGGLVSERNDTLRRHLVGYITSKIGHRPDLMRKTIPASPPFAKRLIADNGWYDALLKPHVALVTNGIERITPTGILSRDGTHEDFDLIVLGAGFKTERYLWPVRYEGRGGITLEQAWEKDGARAYLGMTTPGFPNLFILYGPNGQARASGLMSWLEIWARYAVKAIAGMIETGGRSMEVRTDVHDRYNARMDEALRECIWGSDGSRSYYFNEFGRQNTNMPWEPAEYFAWVRAPEAADFEIRP